MPLLPGVTILNNKYRILRQFGEEGMACVWLAEALTFSSCLIALKEPRPDLSIHLQKEARQRYGSEVRVRAAPAQAGVPHMVRALTA
jgi:hypothetical protein